MASVNSTYHDFTAHSISDEALPLLRDADRTVREEKPPVIHESDPLELNVIIKASPYIGDDVIDRVVEAFNRGINASDVVTVDFIRGSRVPQGILRFFKINTQPFVVGPTDRNMAPVLYPFSATTVEKLSDHDQTSRIISLFGRHILNIPQGHIALAMIGNDPVFYGEGIHVIHSGRFTFDKEKGIVPLSSRYIHYGNYHILTVPSGKIAKAAIGGKPLFLESSSKPYVFCDPRFELIKNGDAFFHDASEKVIINGALKRLIINTGEVAVTYKYGELTPINPTGKPILIQDPAHCVANPPFISTAIQTVIFPFENGQFEQATTADGVNVEIRLMITYKIDDVLKAVSMLGMHPDILKHVEFLALTDMRNAVQSCNFYDVQKTSSTRTKPDASGGGHSNESAPSAPEMVHIQDEIRTKLTAELKEVGIDLARLTFEEFRIADKDVRANRSKNAQVVAQTVAAVSNLEQQMILDRETVLREQTVMQIKLDQENQRKIATANSELEQARINQAKESAIAEAVAHRAAQQKMIAQENEGRLAMLQAEQRMIAAKAEADAIIMKANAEAHAALIRAKAEAEGQKLINQVWSDTLQSPDMRQYVFAQAQAKALSGVSTTVVSPEVAAAYYGTIGMRGFAPEPNKDLVLKDDKANAVP